MISEHKQWSLTYDVASSLVSHAIKNLLPRSLYLAGGRYKKEVLVDGQSNLLLIREEAGPPNSQVLLSVCMCAFQREGIEEGKIML